MKITKESIKLLFSKNTLIFLKIEIQEFFEKCVWFFWHAGIKLFWYRLWIRKDELHVSLNYDDRITEFMSEEQDKKYREESMRRKNIAHERDLKRNFSKRRN